MGACGDRAVTVSPDARVRITELRDGSGPKAEEGMLVQVHYVGRLEDGTEIVSTYANQRVHKFVIGDGTVIPGMDRGVIGMRAGGKRRLVMLPQAHYGRQGYGGKVPANATMIFEVEMMRLGRPDSVSGGELHPSDPRRRHPGQRRF